MDTQEKILEQITEMNKQLAELNRLIREKSSQAVTWNLQEMTRVLQLIAWRLR